MTVQVNIVALERQVGPFTQFVIVEWSIATVETVPRARDCAVVCQNQTTRKNLERKREAVN
jgi:hypothetical protein